MARCHPFGAAILSVLLLHHTSAEASVEFTSRDGDFAVVFPFEAAPSRSSRTQKTVFGDAVTTAWMQTGAEGEERIALAGYTQLPDQTLKKLTDSEILDSSQQGATAGAEASCAPTCSAYLVSQEDYTREGLPARALVLRIATTGGDEFFFRYDYVLSRERRRSYVLGYGARTRDGLASSDARSFRESLTLKSGARRPAQPTEQKRDSATLSPSGGDVVVKIQETDVRLPTVDDFVEASKEFPEARKLRERTIPDSNRLLAWYIPPDEIRRRRERKPIEFHRSRSAQLFRPSLETPVSIEQLKRDLRAQQDSMPAVLKEFVTKLQSRWTMPLEIAEPKMIGILGEGPEWISFGMVLPPTKNETQPSMVVAVANVVLAGRLLYLNVQGPLRSPEDLAWAKVTAQKWAEAVLEANR